MNPQELGDFICYAQDPVFLPSCLSFFSQPQKACVQPGRGCSLPPAPAPLTHIAFQKIYLKPRAAATRGEGDSSKMDTIMADIKVAAETPEHTDGLLVCLLLFGKIFT